MKTQPPEVKGTPRIVYGAVAGDGTILDYGSGDWTVIRSAAGSYYVYPAPPFKAKPTIVSVGLTWNVVVLGGSGGQVTPGFVQFTGWVGGTQTDSAFSFIIVGRS